MRGLRAVECDLSACGTVELEALVCVSVCMRRGPGVHHFTVPAFLYSRSCPAAPLELQRYITCGEKISLSNSRVS